MNEEMRPIASKRVKDLEQLARSIAPSLFWTCNFEPTVSYSVNADGMFYEGIQDLYKFAIDTNCVFRPLVFNSKNAIYKQLLKPNEVHTARTHFETVQMLRSVMDHNQSVSNGWIASSNLNAYTQWIQVLIGKEFPEHDEDFLVLCNALKDIGNALIKDSELMLQRLKLVGDRERLTERWTDAIIQWYCKDTRQTYYWGQLMDSYVARALPRNPRFLTSMTDNRLFGKVKSWIHAQVMHERDQLDAKKTELQNSLDHPNKIERELRARYPEDYEKKCADQRKEIQTINERQREIDKEFQDLQNRCGSNPSHWFFYPQRLKKQLQVTLEYLRKSDEGFTLLPQDFLQKDVERNFDGIASPDGDF